VEFGHIAAAPFAGLLLADLGADVVKVEPPDGDGLRSWPPHVADGDACVSLNFVSLNRNKRGIVADLKDDAQKRDVLSLCHGADVVVENYRPGVLDRLGLGFDAVSTGHRGVVYCSISGFGQDGPYRERGAFDVLIQAMSGLMSVTGDAGGAPVKCGVPVADFVSALYAAFSVTALLSNVRRTGRSVHVDCSMLDCMLGISALQISELWGTGVAPTRMGSAHPRNAPYQVFRTADHEMAVAAGTARLWESLCGVLGLDALVDDERFADQPARARHQRELAATVEAVLLERPRAEWIAELDAHGIPCGPVNDFAQIMSDRHVTDGGLVDRIELSHTETPAFRFPIRMSGLEPRESTAPPSRDGADVTAIIAEWGSQP